jgi:predicted O-methyltransferase YrrM
MKNFTKDWNNEFIKNVNGLSPVDLCLEIGCFEGLTSNYIVDNMLSDSGKLICVDPLTDVYLNDNLKEDDIDKNLKEFNFFKDQYERFFNNTKEHIESGKLELLRNLSKEVYSDLLGSYEKKIDFIYIDGDHRASSVYYDAVNCFSLCKRGGYILFDDYIWGNPDDPEYTKIGIDRFLNEYYEKINIIIQGYQVLIKIK